MEYTQLDPDQLIARIDRLHRRVTERFPDRHLTQICAALEVVARDTARRAESARGPIVWLRWTVAAAIAVLVGAAAATASQVTLNPAGGIDVLDLVQTLDAVFNEVVLIGAAVLFLVRTERRVKQQRTLAALHELRSLAHVIDEHQLDKDPDRMLGGLPSTASSQHVDLTPAEVVRYLTYCSEMLSAIGKLAALYLQYVSDAVTVAAVTEVEDLTLGLSAKIWQKIAIFVGRDEVR